MPLKYKIGLLWTLLERCFNIVSNYKLLDEQIGKTRKVFEKNSYPTEFIDQCINGFLTKKFSLPVQTVKKKDVTLVLPYLGKIYQQIAKKLQWVVATALTLRTKFQNPFVPT